MAEKTTFSEEEYTELLRHAAPRQKLYLADLHSGLSQRQTAAKHNVSRSSVYHAIESLRAKAAQYGYDPKHGVNFPTSDGFPVRGTSTLIDNEGNVVMQWIKTNASAERLHELMKEAIAALTEGMPKAKPVPAPTMKSDQLANLMVITDYHLGMLSWPEETHDAPWDTKIAEKLLVDWFEAALAACPYAEVGVLAQLGDFLHFDGLEAITPTSKNVLEADTRFQLLVRVSIRLMRRVVELMLMKHHHVHIIMAEGNHDIASSAWLREVFHTFYEHEPRVTVDLNPDPYYCFEHGNTSLFFHHGHLRKVANISQVFASKFRDVFGRTKHSYAHMGHLHNKDLKEDPLMVVEQHRTLAAADAYASRSGYMSGRDASVITYHKKYGQVSRITINPDMVK